MRRLIEVVVCLSLCSCSAGSIYCVAHGENDLISTLRDEGYDIKIYESVGELIDDAPENAAALLLAPDYPSEVLLLGEDDLEKIQGKNLKVVAEFAEEKEGGFFETLWERAVVNCSDIEGLDSLELLSTGRCRVCTRECFPESKLVLARVAGLDKAEYGLDGTEKTSLLYQKDGIWFITTRISDYAHLRLNPPHRWKAVWEYLISDITGKEVKFKSWKNLCSPSYGSMEKLPHNAGMECIRKGAEWFFNGHFLVDASWKEEWVDRYMGDGTMPVGPALPADAKDGDGSLGILEGHCSRFNLDGSQDYRYWMRADVQGEVAMALASSGKILGRDEYMKIAENLMDYVVREYRDGPRNDPSSPSYGLFGWAYTHKYVYYGDDNARLILGMILAGKLTGTHRHDEDISEAIMANFRTTGCSGFRGDRLEDDWIQEKGLEFFKKYDISNPHPHFESWLWACYLWLYNRNSDLQLLEMSERAIRATMEAYPDRWLWTNGIQQERARMILPLAWLYRVSPTEEHLDWLEFMCSELLENQVDCGAIREELGDPSSGLFGKISSNAEYGLREAPIIFENGDPIADMLYTCNFAFFGLNEAAAASGSGDLKLAARKMSEFLIRIQVHSECFNDIDGAWLRAFNYEDWNYWAQDADAGWGAGSTLTGWIQSWILTTQVLMESGTSFWDETAQ